MKDMRTEGTVITREQRGTIKSLADAEPNATIYTLLFYERSKVIFICRLRMR